MKTITTTAIVALMTAAAGLTAIAPAYAQDAAPVPTQEQAFRHGGPGPGERGPGHIGLFGLLGNGDSTEAVEIALVRLSHAIDLTTEQQALFETLRTDALAAAETFATTVADLRPADPAEGQPLERPELSDMLENRIAFQTARLDALKAVQPSLAAFLDSLTDEQKADLMPRRPDRMGGPGMHQGQHHQGHGPLEAPALPAPGNG